jgi:hypothetical protein
MIQNDQELKVTQERIAYFLDLLTRLRQGSRPEELALVTSGYRAEGERMQCEVLDYLTQPATDSEGRLNYQAEPVALSPDWVLDRSGRLNNRRCKKRG